MIGTIQWTVARLLLAAARDPYDPLLDEASAYADQMDALGLGFTVVQARLSRAAIARRRGAPVTALALLAEAERLAVSAGMEDAAAAARWRAGEILGGDEGRERVAAAAQALSALGARRPDRMVEVVAPGFDPPRG